MSPYDPLADGARPMAAGELRGFLRQGLLDQQQRALAGHEVRIGCEHSSGLDSNAVPWCTAPGSPPIACTPGA